MRGGFRWDAGGAGTARRRDMRERIRHKKNCGSSVTLAMRRVAGGCRGSGCGIRSGLWPGPWALTLRTGIACAFRFATYARTGIVLRRTECWRLMWWKHGGWSGIATAECSGWRNAFWNLMLRRGRSRKSCGRLARIQSYRERQTRASPGGQPFSVSLRAGGAAVPTLFQENDQGKEERRL
jgi:hypothetical protein